MSQRAGATDKKKLDEQIRGVAPYLAEGTRDVLYLDDQVGFNVTKDEVSGKRTVPPAVVTELTRLPGKSSSHVRRKPGMEPFNFFIPESTKLFTGMEQKKAEFRESLVKSNLISIEGLGGIGKTEFALRCIAEFLPRKKVVWFECSPDSNVDALIELSGYPEVLKGENKTELAKYSGFVDLIERDNKALFLDNFHLLTGDSFEKLLNFAEKKLKRARIIVVSREHPSFNVKLVPIELHGLGDEALLYAQRFRAAYHGGLEVSESDLKDICVTLDGHPLAIELALQLLSYGESPKNMLERIVRAEDKSRALSSRLLDEVFNHPTSTEGEKEFLLRFSVFRTELDRGIISSIFDNEDVSSTLYRLIHKKMVSVSRGLYRIHPLIREFCYQRLSGKEAAHEKAASCLKKRRTDRFDPFLEAEIFYHVFGSNNKVRIANFTSDTGDNFILSGHTNFLTEIIDRVLTRGLNRPEYHVFLGDIATLRGEWSDASRHFKEAFFFNDAYDRITAGAYIKFGEILYRQGEVKEALEYFENAYKDCGRHGCTKEQGRAANDIGLVFQIFGDVQRAKQWLGDGLDIRKAIGDNEGIAISLNNIGLVLKGQGDLSGALKQYEQSLKIQEEIGNKAGIAISLNNIGLVLKGQGDLPGALKQYEQSLKIQEEIGNKAGIAISLNNIGAVFQGQGDLSGALKQHEQSLKIQEEIGNKAGIAISLNNIGLVLKGQGDLSGALKQYEQSLKIQEEIGNKAGIAISLNNIGTIWHSKKDDFRALQCLLKSFALRDECGLDKSDIVDSIHQIRKELGLKKFRDMYQLVRDSLGKDLQTHIHLKVFTEDKTVVRGTGKVGRNDPCTCGSGRKYKKCCGE